MEFKNNDYQLCSSCQDSVHEDDIEYCTNCDKPLCSDCIAEYLSEFTDAILCKECAEQETGWTEDEREIIENSYYDKEVFEAARNCDIDIENVDEAYSGYYEDDAEFAQELCEDIGYIPKDFPWFITIDWKSTAQNILIDYCEHDGHYFRMF